MAEEKNQTAANVPVANATSTSTNAPSSASGATAPAAGSNTVTDETGQFDARFMLWRSFCARYDVPVDALPSELSGEAKEAWEKLKDNALHKPAEGK